MRILLVDEHAENRDRIRCVLLAAFDDLDLAAVGDRQAYERALAGGAFDLVLTEHDLSWTDGLAVLRDVRARRPGSPVIMVTGPGAQRLATQGFRAGLQDFISTDHLDELVPAVRRAMDCRRTSAAMYDSERRLAFVVENSEDNVFLQDLDLRYVWLSKPVPPFTVEDYLGHTDLEMSGPQEQLEQLAAIKQRVLDAGQAVSVELELNPQKGDRRTFQATYKPWLDDEGRVIGLAGYVSEITESRRAEEGLRASENLAQRHLAEIDSIYASAHIGLCVFDADLRYVRINTYLAEINGIPAADHIGKTPREMVPDLADKAEATFRQIMETGEPVLDMELSGTTARDPNRVRTWIAHWLPLKTPEGQVTGVSVVVDEITERKQAEADLRESEERFRFVVNHTPDTLFLQDLDLRHVWIYNPTEPLTARDVVGKTEIDLMPPEEAAQVIALKQHVLATGTATQAEVRLTLGGIPRWYEAVYEPWRDANGQIAGIITFSRDITARKEAEAERERLLAQNRRQRAQLEAVLNQMPSGVVIVEVPSGRLLMSNARAEEIWQRGYATWSTLEDLTSVKRFHPDGRLYTLEEWPLTRSARNAEVVIGEEIGILRTDGTRRAIRVSSSPVTDERGEITAAVAVFVDLTELKALEQEIRGERELLQTIYDTIPVMLTLYDPALEEVTPNKHYYQVTGWTPADLEETHILQLEYPDPGDREEAADYMRTLSPGYRDFTMVGKQGQAIESSWANVKLADGRQVGIGIDITARKQAEEELRRYAAELEQANEANRLLLSEVNHRVKNNLTAILGLIFAEQRRLSGKTLDPDAPILYREALEDLGERVRSLATVHGMLSASGWRALRVDQLVGEVIQASMSATGDAEALVLKIRGSPISITPGQAHHLALIVGELTTNTLKYGHSGERLHISVDIESANGEVRVVYRNRGPGYPEHVLAGEGHSVGLGLVRTLTTHSLRGTWSLRNEDGPVTEIRFPIALDLRDESIEAPVPELEAQARNE